MVPLPFKKKRKKKLASDIMVSSSIKQGLRKLDPASVSEPQYIVAILSALGAASGIENPNTRVSTIRYILSRINQSGRKSESVKLLNDEFSEACDNARTY